MGDISADHPEIQPYLFDKNPSPMLIFDQDSLQIVKVNEAACQKYGYSQQEFQKI